MRTGHASTVADEAVPTCWPQVPCVVAEARAALQQGMCVVIGLQSTGEAAADAIGLEPGPVPGYVSTTKELLYRLVEGHFPTREERLDEHGGWPGAWWLGARLVAS